MATPTRWVGIDEAGYGPNLGPLVMSAVVAESIDDRPPDLWADLADTVCRAGGKSDRLWVDDSKAIYKGGAGRDRLEAACMAMLAAVSKVPATLGDLLQAIHAGTIDDAELSPWLDAGDPPFSPDSKAGTGGPFDHPRWRIVDVRAVVVGPSRFNAELAEKASKAGVHFAAFARLLGPIWEAADDGVVTHVVGDKHGGRHFYHEPLLDAFPDAWIDRGLEGPASSHYTLRQEKRRVELTLRPRADADNGLVALASIVSKTVRESWMDSFNAYWLARLPGIRRTAGYPLDAARFRREIEPSCRDRGLEPSLWWRAR